MSRRRLVRSVAFVWAALWLAPSSVTGQNPRPASDRTAVRTTWGDPDLQGIWSYATITPLQRPAPLAEREFLTAEEVAEQNQREATRASSERRAELTVERDLALAYNQFWWDRGTSTGRTSLIVDPPNGRLPPLTPEAERRQAAQRDYRRAHPYDSWEDRPLQERCMTYQRAPPVPSGYNNTYHILQTPGYVAIFNEMIHDVRFVPLDGRPPIDERIRQWNGDSRGRWDGDTLVVETRNFSEQTQHRYPSSPETVAVERFRRIDDNTIEHTFTLEDDGVYTRPWTAMRHMPRLRDYIIYEYACHEGNYAMTNILNGERSGERAAAGSR